MSRSRHNGALIGSMPLSFLERNPFPESTPHPMVVGVERIGIEIEVENARHITYSSENWENKSDGSLRGGGREFVLRRPLGGAELVSAIQEITTVFEQHQPDCSWRCSTHLHMNMKTATVAELKRTLLACTVFEKILFKCGCMNRYKNNFCMPYHVAQEQIHCLSNNWNLQDLDFVTTVSSEWSKYSSLNLKPLYRLGSIELRIGNATTSFDELLGMCNRLLTTRELSRNWRGSETDFVQMLASTPFHNIFNKKVCLSYEVDSSDIIEGVENAMNILTLGPLKTQMRSLAVFEASLSREVIEDLRGYIERNITPPTRGRVLEIFNRLGNMSYDDVMDLLNYCPFSPESLLTPESFSLYTSVQ